MNLVRTFGLAVVAIALRATLAVAAAEPACWVVTSPTTTAYLLGSIHVARPSLYPLAESIESAFAISDVIVVEAEPFEGKPDPEGMLSGLAIFGAYPAEDSLERHVPPETVEAVAKRLPMPREFLVRLRPWLLAFTLIQADLGKLGVTPEHGVDVHFLRRRGKRRTIALEGVEAQLEMLASFDEKLQTLFLESTLRELDQLAANVEAMIDAWSRGDTTALERLLFAGRRADPALEPVYRKLFDERNVTMARKIEELLAGHDTVFVIVGAGHLVGPSSIVDLLDDRYGVKRLAGQGGDETASPSAEIRATAP